MIPGRRGQLTLRGAGGQVPQQQWRPRRGTYHHLHRSAFAAPSITSHIQSINRHAQLCLPSGSCYDRLSPLALPSSWSHHHSVPTAALQPPSQLVSWFPLLPPPPILHPTTGINVQTYQSHEVTLLVLKPSRSCLFTHNSTQHPELSLQG